MFQMHGRASNCTDVVDGKAPTTGFGFCAGRRVNLYNQHYDSVTIHTSVVMTGLRTLDEGVHVYTFIKR